MGEYDRIMLMSQFLREFNAVGDDNGENMKWICKTLNTFENDDIVKFLNDEQIALKAKLQIEITNEFEYSRKRQRTAKTIAKLENSYYESYEGVDDVENGTRYNVDINDLFTLPIRGNISKIKLENFVEPVFCRTTAKEKTTYFKSDGDNLKAVANESWSSNRDSMAQLSTSKTIEHDDEPKSSSKSFNRKRRVEENESCGVAPWKRNKVELKALRAPERVPSTAYHFFLENYYCGQPKNAKKHYMELCYGERQRIKEQHQQRYTQYLAEMKEYHESQPKKPFLTLLREYVDQITANKRPQTSQPYEC